MSFDLRRFWKQWHNKFLATAFIAISLILVIGYYATMGITLGMSYFYAYPGEVWNLFIYLIVYGIVLYGNIRNNNIAYSGILMFVFMLTLDAAFSVFENVIYSFSGDIFTLLGTIFMIPEIVFGILYYKNINCYLSYRSNNFKKLRVFGIIFVSLISLKSIPFVLLAILGNSPLLLISIGVQLSEVFCGLSSIFTVERIRR